MAIDDCIRGRGRPKIYWREVSRDDMTQFKCDEDMTLALRLKKTHVTIRVS